MNNDVNAERGAVSSTAGLDLLGVEDFEGFLCQCETLAQDLEIKNPYGADGDGWRVRKLIEIAKASRSNGAHEPPDEARPR